MTYNVHRCIGGDRVLAPSRIARIIAEQEPDVVALQELDIGHARTQRADQPALLAALLDMRCFFHPAMQAEDEHYGDAILSRHPLRLVKAGVLPTLPSRPHLERRGALWAEVEVNGRVIQLLNTHLGLNGRERLAQVEALLGPDWLGHPDCTAPRILCGDLNAPPGTLAYRRVRRVLHDAYLGGRVRWNHGTFPTRWPMLRIDHVFLSPEWIVRDVKIPRTYLSRIASDHLPLLVEVSLG
jgi:endonuclease/exonuclease/phosphatase family metal-dependent hydrolase